MTASALQPVYVLHTRDYRDTSLLVDLFCRDQGRVRCVARGARRSSRGGRQRSVLQPFVPLLAAWAGRGELKTLSQVEAAGPPLPLGGRALISGLYLNELLSRLLQPEDAHPLLYQHYCETLIALGQGEPLDIPLRRFELRLLEEIGYGVTLELEADSGAPVAADRYYRWRPGLGLVAAAGDDDSYLGSDLLAIAAEEFTANARRAARRLCRQLLDEQLGGRPLKSRELLS